MLQTSGRAAKSLNLRKERCQKWQNRSAFPGKEQSFLTGWCDIWRYKSALELGTSLGIGTAAMAAGNSVNSNYRGRMS